MTISRYNENLEANPFVTAMNAQMRRIDLVCKLLGPLFIALIDGISTEAAIMVNLGMNVCSVVVEYYSIAKVRPQSLVSRLKEHFAYNSSQVYDEVPELQEAKKSPPRPHGEEPAQQGFFVRGWSAVCQGVRQALKDFGFYFRHRVFLPSFAGALLYLTVLSFSGQMVTWLLSTGYDSTQVAVTRTLAVAFEVLATWVAPWLMERIGPTRAGLWLASWQITCLAGGFAIFWHFASQPFLSASGLVGGVILSRLGLRGFDLCAQILVQEVSFSESCQCRVSGVKKALTFIEIYRALKPRQEVPSPRLKLHGRTCLRSVPISPPSFSHVQINSNGRPLSA
jgi:iron-regulated transporter 1